MIKVIVGIVDVIEGEEGFEGGVMEEGVVWEEGEGVNEWLNLWG